MYNGQLLQDMFVDKLLDKDRGVFLDIGAGTGGVNSRDPGFYSNTYYFEKERNWTGLAIDIDEYWFSRVFKARPSTVCCDLTTKNINQVLEQFHMPEYIDYLSFDVDAAQMHVFSELDWDKYKFGVITFEHNLFAAMKDSPQNHTPQQQAEILREYLIYHESLEDMGYVPLWQDVVLNQYGPVETWWVSKEIHGETDIPILHKPNCQEVRNLPWKA